MENARICEGIHGGAASGQHQDRQFIAMKEYGVPERNIYSDKQSGKDFDRPGVDFHTFKKWVGCKR